MYKYEYAEQPRLQPDRRWKDLYSVVELATAKSETAALTRRLKLNRAELAYLINRISAVKVQDADDPDPINLIKLIEAKRAEYRRAQHPLLVKALAQAILEQCSPSRKKKQLDAMHSKQSNLLETADSILRLYERMGDESWSSEGMRRVGDVLFTQYLREEHAVKMRNLLYLPSQIGRDSHVQQHNKLDVFFATDDKLGKYWEDSVMTQARELLMTGLTDVEGVGDAKKLWTSFFQTVASRLRYLMIREVIGSVKGRSAESLSRLESALGDATALSEVWEDAIARVLWSRVRQRVSALKSNLQLYLQKEGSLDNLHVDRQPLFEEIQTLRLIAEQSGIVYGNFTLSLDAAQLLTYLHDWAKANRGYSAQLPT